MAIERRRRRPPRKKPHPKRKREHTAEKHTRRRKRKQRKPKATGTTTPSTAGAGGGSAGGGESAVVSTPDNTGTDQGMSSPGGEVPATLTGQAPANDGPAGYFSTGPGQAEHYHPVLTFVHMVAEHTDETTTEAGSTAAVASSGTENNPT